MFNRWAVAGDFISCRNTTDGLFRMFNGSFHDGICFFCIQWWNQTHVDPDFTVIRHNIGTITAGDLPERNRGTSHIRVNRCIQNRMSDLTNDLSHGGNGIGTFPWRVCMGSVSLHINFIPGAAFVCHLNLSIGRFSINHPVTVCNPASLYTRFGTTHEIFFVHGTNQF